MNKLVMVAMVVIASGCSTTRHAPDAIKKNGIVQTRWSDGTLKREAAYRDDVYDGTYRTWYQSGRPYELRHYRLGHEEGLQQAWTERGELYINYEVRNGRNFGLVNSMPCLPVGPEETTLPYYATPDFTPQWSPVTHKISSFNLMTQTGRNISERDLDGRIHVASFIYTSCAAVCPIIVNQLKRVQAAVRVVPNVLLVSYSVTPADDSPTVLAAFGRDRGIDPKRWWLVTGRREQIYALARQSYFADDGRIGPESAAPSEAFLHTEKVFLIDAQRRLRGIYNGTQPHSIDQLIGDIRRLVTDSEPGRSPADLPHDVP